jgi:hypothetical protein
MVISRRRFFLAALTLAGAAGLLNFSNCMTESGALKALRQVLNKLESALKTLMAMGLVSDLIQAAAKYLESVSAFVHQAAEVLEDNLLSAAEKASKIIQLGASVVLPNIPDAKVQSILQNVQAAVALFLALFAPPKPAAVELTEHSREALHQIEVDASRDQADVVKWASAPHPSPTGAPK